MDKKLVSEQCLRMKSEWGFLSSTLRSTMDLENSLLWTMKTWVGWGREAGALVTNGCNTVLLVAVAASCSLLTSSSASVPAG